MTDDAHLSIDRLADLGADALPRAEVSAAQAHLRSCSECRATAEHLAALPAFLAGVEHPPMPADVSVRVVAAIEREQLARAGEAEHAPAAVSPARPQPADLRRRFGAKLGAGLLGATAVLGGGYLVVSGSFGGNDEPSVADQGAGVIESDSLAGEEAAAPTATGYGADSLDEDVRQLVASSELTLDTARTPGEVEGEDGQVGEPGYVATKLRACVAETQREADTDATPLAVDLSTYEGEPAVVIVFAGPGRNTSAPLDVWVVGSGCVDGSEQGVSDTGVDVLTHETVAR